MKVKELRKKKQEELKKMLLELRSELMRLMSQKASGVRPENPGRIRSIKRDIARILTVLREKEKA